MTDRELAVWSGAAEPDTAAERTLAAAAPAARDFARVLLENRRRARGCPEHEFVTRADGPAAGGLDRPFECRHCGFRVYDAYLLAYAAEAPRRAEARAWKESGGVT